MKFARARSRESARARALLMQPRMTVRARGRSEYSGRIRNCRMLLQLSKSRMPNPGYFFLNHAAIVIIFLAAGNRVKSICDISNKLLSI